MKKKSLILILTALLVITGCADVVPIDNSSLDDPYGFWAGIWHGLIILFSFIGSLFSDDIAVYAVNNKGALYDLGFVIGIAIWRWV